MSISSEITRIQNKRDLSFAEVENKGVTVPAGSTIDDLPGLIAQIEQGSGSGSGGIIYQDLDGYLNLSEDAANVISIVDTLDTAGGTVRTITGAVESGDGYTANDWADRTKPVGEVSCDVAIAYDGNRGKYSSLLQNRTGITKASLPNATYIPDSYCQGCTGLTSFYAPLATATGGNCFYGCTSLEYAVLPSFEWNGSSSFYNCNNMLAADLGPNASSMATYFFRDCAKMATLILRGSSICSLTHTTVFNGTPFASGKAGGTIYIPKSLYDHLGDNSSLDYKAATNWSTVDGYGTITWAQIEGSIYETQYADGTPIPTT